MIGLLYEDVMLLVWCKKGGPGLLGVDDWRSANVDGSGVCDGTHCGVGHHHLELQ